MISGAILLTMLVYAVETSKFVVAWMDYKSAVRALRPVLPRIRAWRPAFRFVTPDRRQTSIGSHGIRRHPICRY